MIQCPWRSLSNLQEAQTTLYTNLDMILDLLSLISAKDHLYFGHMQILLIRNSQEYTVELEETKYRITAVQKSCAVLLTVP